MYLIVNNAFPNLRNTITNFHCKQGGARDENKFSIRHSFQTVEGKIKNDKIEVHSIVF